MSIEELIRSYKYPFEEHEYQTEDGYLNMVHRIPGTIRTLENAHEVFYGKPVVLYQHGLMDSAAGLCCNGETSIAFALADAGFDVWMNNNRGTTYSRKHTTLDPDKDDDYWDYSFQEMGKYDQPAVWNFILTKTGQQKLTYIGHSQGTSQMLAGACMNPDFFRQRANAIILCAPVATVGDVQSLGVHQMKDSETVRELLKKMGPELFAKPGVKKVSLINNNFAAFF